MKILPSVAILYALASLCSSCANRQRSLESLPSESQSQLPAYLTKNDDWSHELAGQSRQPRSCREFIDQTPEFVEMPGIIVPHESRSNVRKWSFFSNGTFRATQPLIHIWIDRVGEWKAMPNGHLKLTGTETVGSTEKRSFEVTVIGITLLKPTQLTELFQGMSQVILTYESKKTDNKPDAGDGK
jgi:hypothetical protein